MQSIWDLNNSARVKGRQYKYLKKVTAAAFSSWEEQNEKITFEKSRKKYTVRTGVPSKYKTSENILCFYWKL